jgi:hypothetical protein
LHFNEIHGVMSQKREAFMSSALRTCRLTIRSSTGCRNSVLVPQCYQLGPIFITHKEWVF